MTVRLCPQGLTSASAFFQLQIKPKTEMDSKHIFRTFKTLELVTGILIPYAVLVFC